MVHNRAMAQGCRQGRCHATSSTKQSTENAIQLKKDAHCDRVGIIPEMQAWV